MNTISPSYYYLTIEISTDFESKSSRRKFNQIIQKFLKKQYLGMESIPNIVCVTKNLRLEGSQT